MDFVRSGFECVCEIKDRRETIFGSLRECTEDDAVDRGRQFVPAHGRGRGDIVDDSLQELHDFVGDKRDGAGEHLVQEDPDRVDIGPCVAHIGKLVCVGLNYSDHAAESNMPVPTEPILFLKPSSAVCGPGDDVEIPVPLGTLVYDDETGMFAARVWWMLRYLGFDSVKVLDGGFSAWQAAGYPVSTEPAESQPAVFVPQVRPEMLATRDETLAALGNEAILLLDARSPERYRGTVDAVAGLESRGFILAAPLAYALGAGMITIRKAGRLPGPVDGVDYTLEYGTARLELRPETVGQGQRVLIIDDVLATGGTASAAIRLIEGAGGQVTALAMLLELDALRGRDKLTGYRVDSIIHY